MLILNDVLELLHSQIYSFLSNYFDQINFFLCLRINGSFTYAYFKLQHFFQSQLSGCNRFIFYFFAFFFIILIIFLIIYPFYNFRFGANRRMYWYNDDVCFFFATVYIFSGKKERSDLENEKR